MMLNMKNRRTHNSGLTEYGVFVLGYEKGINIFLFPTFHDIILIDFSVI
jgi:hypothetical protein